MHHIWDWISDQWLLKNHWTLPENSRRLDAEVHDECVKCVQGSAHGSEGDTGERMPLVYIPQYKRANSCVSAVISAFFSVCVKVKTEPDYRAFWIAVGGGGRCRHVCTQRLPFWTQAAVAFLALGAGSCSQISRNLGNVRGGISLVVNMRTRDGRVMRGGEGRAGKEGCDLFCLSFVAPWRTK